MAVAVTERVMGGSKAVITATGTEAEVAACLAAGTGVSAPKYYWNGDPNRILWQTGIVGAVSVCYLTTNV
jgi:hypothetical protein